LHESALPRSKSPFLLAQCLPHVTAKTLPFYQTLCTHARTHARATRRISTPSSQIHRTDRDTARRATKSITQAETNLARVHCVNVPRRSDSALCVVAVKGAPVAKFVKEVRLRSNNPSVDCLHMDCTSKSLQTPHSRARSSAGLCTPPPSCMESTAQAE
jgi:hypothetical protein